MGKPSGQSARHLRGWHPLLPLPLVPCPERAVHLATCPAPVARGLQTGPTGRAPSRDRHRLREWKSTPRLRLDLSVVSQVRRQETPLVFPVQGSTWQRLHRLLHLDFSLILACLDPTQQRFRHRSVRHPTRPPAEKAAYAFAWTWTCASFPFFSTGCIVPCEALCCVSLLIASAFLLLPMVSTDGVRDTFVLAQFAICGF